MNNINSQYNSSNNGIFQPASRNNNQNIIATNANAYSNSKMPQTSVLGAQQQMMPQENMPEAQQQAMPQTSVLGTQQQMMPQTSMLGTQQQMMPQNGCGAQKQMMPQTSVLGAQQQMMPQTSVLGAQQQQMAPQNGTQNPAYNNGRTYNVPETVTNPYFWPAYLKNYIGYWMRVTSFVGNSFTDYTGRLIEVGAAYIVLKPLAPDVIEIIDMYSIKYVSVILTTDPQRLLNGTNYTNYVVTP